MFPIVSIGKVQDRGPFVSGSFIWFLDCTHHFLLLLTPVTDRRVLWRKVSLSVQGGRNEGSGMGNVSTSTAPITAENMFRAGWAELLAMGAGSPRAVFPEKAQLLALCPQLGLCNADIRQCVQHPGPCLLRAKGAVAE